MNGKRDWFEVNLRSQKQNRMKKLALSLLASIFTGTLLFAASNAKFISQQSVPATAKTGASYWIKITMQNNGTTTWTSGGVNPFRLGSTNPDNNFRWGVARVELPSAQVLPGQNAVFSFKILAPDTAGVHDFQWHMVQDGIEWFGDLTPNTQITVTASNNTFDKSKIDPKRFGAYFWAGYFALANPGPSFLLTGEKMVEEIGSEMIRLAIGPSTDNTYHLNGGNCIQNSSLKSLVQRADFKQIFSNPQFKTYMFTAYDWVTGANCNSKVLTPSFYTPANIALIENEYKDLAQYLGTTYPDKKFIVAHWEGDNYVYNANCIAADSCKARLGAFTKWINARTAGIHAAGVNNVFSCMEFNYRAGFDPGPLNLLHDALPNIQADYFSYSAWASTWMAATNEADQFKSEIHAMRSIIANAGHDSTKLIIGEFGYNYSNRQLSRDKHVVLAQAIHDLDIPYAIIWHTLDVDGGNLSPFGLYDPNAVLTATGQEYCKLWSGKECGNVSDAGILSLISPTNDSCPGTLSPRVTLKNFGNYVLDAIKISYSVDNGPAVHSQFSVSYNSGLAANNTINLNLNASAFTAGPHVVKVWSSLPNGKNDAQNANDTLTANVNIQCNLTGVEEAAGTIDLRVFPSPAVGSVSVEFGSNSLEQFEMKFVNSLGQTVEIIDLGQQPAGHRIVNLDVSQYPSGIYSLVLSGENNLIAKKIVILK